MGGQACVLYGAAESSLSMKRPLLAHAAAGEKKELERALGEEEAAERARDRLYWLPLRHELESLRHSR